MKRDFVLVTFTSSNDEDCFLRRLKANNITFIWCDHANQFAIPLFDGASMDECIEMVETMIEVNKLTVKQLWSEKQIDIATTFF